MNTRLLTEAEAWERIALEIERTEGMPGMQGLCHEAGELQRAGLISEETEDAMCGWRGARLETNGRVWRHMDTPTESANGLTMFVTEHGDEYWQVRCMLAQLFALEAADEAAAAGQQ